MRLRPHARCGRRVGQLKPAHVFGWGSTGAFLARCRCWGFRCQGFGRRRAAPRKAGDHTKVVITHILSSKLDRSGRKYHRCGNWQRSPKIEFLFGTPLRGGLQRVWLDVGEERVDYFFFLMNSSMPHRLAAVRETKCRYTQVLNGLHQSAQFWLSPRQNYPLFFSLPTTSNLWSASHITECTSRRTGSPPGGGGSWIGGEADGCLSRVHGEFPCGGLRGQVSQRQLTPIKRPPVGQATCMCSRRSPGKLLLDVVRTCRLR